MTIFNAPSFQSQELKQVTLEHKRFYEDKEGNQFPSVTTFLSKTKDQTFLKAWRKRVGDAEADRISKAATSFGTKLHSIAESLLANSYSTELFEGNSVFECRFSPVKDFLEKEVAELLGSEIMLYSKTLQLAGSCDLVYKNHQGDVIVADFKTSKSKKKLEWLEDYFLQISVYALMVSELYDQEITKGELLFSYENGTFESVCFQPTSYFGTLKKRLKLFREMVSLEKESSSVF